MKRPVIISLLIVALVLVCMGIGAVVFFGIGANSIFADNSPFDRRNISSQVEENKTLKVDITKPVSLNVNDAAGGVTVTGADVDGVQIKITKTAYDSSQARADAEVKTIQYSIKQDGNSILLTYELPKSMNFSNNINTVDFTVTVPTETAVKVTSSTGDVNVTGVQGQVGIDNKFGDIAVEKVDGALDVKTNSGGIDVNTITAGSGDVILNSGFGAISMNQVSGTKVTAGSNSGKLELQNVRATKDMNMSSDFGNVKFDNGSSASLTVSTKSGSIDLTSLKVSGAMVIKNDFGDIDLEQVNAGSYDLQTNSGSITVDGAQGTVKTESGFGNITIKNTENATIQLSTKSGSISFAGSLGKGPHTLHSDFGEIELAIPADSALNVDLQTDFGKIRSDIPVTITLTGEVDEGHTVGTINGGGSPLNASTKSGNITVKTSGE
jgi:DUF4097 and DUF4098 domain-containing protein YvlB